MAAKEVKSALKNAREAIKNKEYKEALKHCKAVLKLEKNNYNAWVFIGVSACELDQPDQAQTAYRKASELEPEQPLAWQGLANLYEKNNQADFKAELPSVYQKLVTLYESSDIQKCCEVCKKLADLFLENKDYLQVARTFRKLIQLKEDGRGEKAVDKGEVLQLWKQMIQLLADSVEEQDNETQQHLITAFEKAMTLTDSVPSDGHKKLLIDYISCLSKLQHEQLKTKEICETMLSLYPEQTFPLEELGKWYLKTSVNSDEAARCFTQLLDLDENSGLGRIGFGVRALEEGKYEEAIKHLAQGLKRMRSSTLAWYSLAQGQIKMHRYRDSVVSCNQGLKCCCAKEEELRTKLLQLRLEALLRSGGEQNADEALETLSQIPHADKDPVLMSFKGRAYLQKGSLDQVFQLSTELLASNPGLADAVALQGLAHLAKDELQQAEQNFLKAVELRPDSWEYYFLLGRLYWHMGKESQRDKSKTQTHLLKAAKLDPFLGPAFRYLGHYYREITKDRVRARGCYKRAFELDNGDVESGAATVDLSMEQGDMDSALEVLKAVTEKATPGSAKWAWMRRGLYHLKIGQHSQAIADLQAALRADPQDCICWECLGEAYLNRRSFTAALKAFARAHQLNQESIYNLYQMAAIKQTLGKFKEAASEYLQIIKREEYVPALKGLGECHLAMARAALEDYLDGRAVDLIQEAISYLFRAVRQRPDLSCLWKLLGDACTATHTVSPNRARVLIPGTLSGLDPPDQEHTLTQTQVLKLGERCYAQALKLMAEAANLWYDLGLNYYHQSSRLTSPEQDPEYKLLLEKSLQCVKKAVMLDSSNHSYWNALGVVAMSKGIENFALAQHSFIKSVKMEANNVVAWTNLGTLYLKKENIELAHEAFKIAQSLEPLYVRCWIGQALIAETVGSYDTMDLFRHTTELSTHTEGVKGYAFWVCSTLLDKSNRDSELYRYNIIQMNAVSAAQVALCKYTERIQTDSGAFTMLGYLNEHLHLKKQARQAYQRAAELLRSSEQSESLNFALRNYARALCNTGQWDKAVRVYSSTPKEELHDLTGLALACFRAGHLQDSLRAYEQALTVASSEKEKTYILTALAILQHRQGCMDVAKTLLFKCSMLQEPAAESLLSLCALGLVHSDSTLASAALSELLKRTSGQGTVEERCILTCTLLALQGNYSAVQKEAARAVHSNPGNPSLWALLSRLVPQYYPRKADGGAVAGSVACLSSMTQGKKALLFSGINQLASGRHSIEDKMRNALKTIQTAVRLCPDDPAGWAALMAACHTENTARLLSSSAPRREGLERQLMTLVSEKVRVMEERERPLARALEAWALQQAVSGLKQSGQPAEAEAICKQVEPQALSPEQPAVFLLLRQIQCESLLLSRTTLPSSVLEQLSSAVLANEACVQAWHWLAEVYRLQGLLVQAVMAYRQSLQLASQLGSFSGKVASLLRLALLALGPCMASVQGAEWKDLVLEATTEALKLGPCPIALLIQALLQFSIKMGARETRRLLERIVYTPSPLQPETVTSVARWYLLRHLHAKDDHELMDTLMDHAKAAGDSKLVEFHKQLSS
ncbi:tetratricopeptide repeat protein 37 isoform X1 [Scleropages formosus]|uniref:tetratricopeptide repeat protein 37 isoform X1 n=1 Tax=Scleropages formosus TaxID=113540 RepID=UPI000878D1D2|nr:tetratricopeptide repeat protein 37 isoform X1 [Scleropages formosus]XP_018614967.1 tetratricopeptide repeat protein 37 isoform X1 [Scleropages formosus]